MALFNRRKKDPAAEAYDKMVRDRVAKKQWDFIGQTGKMDPNIEETDKYKKAEEKFRAEISKPIEESYGYNLWYPKGDQETVEIMNSMKPDDVAQKVEWMRRVIRDGRVGSYHNNVGSTLDNMPVPHAEKHKVAVEFFHHDRAKPFEDADFHSSKTSIDKVLEEMTRHPLNPENRERVVNAIDSFKKEMPQLHEYLTDKYKFATTQEPIQPFVDYSDKDSILTPEEVDKYKDTHVFIHNRTLCKAPDTTKGEVSHFDMDKYQLHPDGKLNRISKLIPKATAPNYSVETEHPFQDEDDLRSKNWHHGNLRGFHADHINADPALNESVSNYTRDSGEFNRYLAKGTMGSKGDSWAHVWDNQSESLTRGMNEAPPYGHKLTVWSGLSKSNDVGAYKPKNTEGGYEGKLIGHFPAFTSTSLDAKEAQGFSREKDAKGFPHQGIRDMVKLEIPKAYHRGLYVDGVSHSPGEYEYILDKEHTFEFHPKPLYVASKGSLYRVWKGRPILSDEDKEILQKRSRNAQTF